MTERKAFPVINPKAKTAEHQAELKARWSEAKQSALARGANISTDVDFLEYLLDYIEGGQAQNRMTPREANLNDINKLINAQIKLNEGDESTAKLKNGNIVSINKRRITPAWVQSELGCSFNAITAALGTKDEPTELKRQIEKHHEKFDIGEHHNRAVLRAKASLDKGQAELKGELLNAKELAGIA